MVAEVITQEFNLIIFLINVVIFNGQLVLFGKNILCHHSKLFGNSLIAFLILLQRTLKGRKSTKQHLPQSYECNWKRFWSQKIQMESRQNWSKTTKRQVFTCLQQICWDHRQQTNWREIVCWRMGEDVSTKHRKIRRKAHIHTIIKTECIEFWFGML